MKEIERGPFFPKLRVRIKDNNSSPHGKFHRFLFPFSCKFLDLNFASYVLYIYLCGTHSEPGLPVIRPALKQYSEYLGLTVSISNGLGLFQQLNYTSVCILPPVCSLQSAFYTDRFEIKLVRDC